MQKQRSSSSEKENDQCFVRNSSFLSRDIEAKKGKEIGKDSPPKTASPPSKASPKKISTPKSASMPKDVISPPPTASTFKIKRTDSKVEENSVVAIASKIEAACSPPTKVISPPSRVTSPPSKAMSSPSKVISHPTQVISPPSKVFSPPSKVASPPTRVIPPPNKVSPPLNKVTSNLNKEVISPSVTTGFKINRADSKENSGPPKVPKRENSLIKEASVKIENSSSVSDKETTVEMKKINSSEINVKHEDSDKSADKNEESNGVGDKIKKFEKAAEDASVPAGRLSRPGSVRGRARSERLGSDGKDDFPPPATPFKDNVHFDLPQEKPDPNHADRQGIMKNNAAHKWQRSESHDEKIIQKPEPQKIIKPEFKPMSSPVDVTIRSPSLGAKVPEQFPSHGTAFRNVASPDQARNAHKFNDDVNTQNNFKPCKLKTKEKQYSVSKGSSYFTRGSEEIWLVKKKDIEEIEERVLDSFRRAGGNICMRSESMRPSSDSGQSVSFSHATMGRTKRATYARSESCDPQYGAARAQTLKRQTSVACTCGHDKKPRAKSAGADATPRPRSRSHGDDAQHVLDKYETLV